MCSVSYEAFEALKNGEYRRAAELLERAAAEAGYASDMINHAYTLALYRIGEKSQLADFAFRVGSSLVGSDPGSAMDYFQRAVLAGLDSDRLRRIAEVHEQWSAERPSKTLTQPVTRVGHVVRSVAHADVGTQYLRLLISALQRRGIESTVFTTESNSSWFLNPDPVPQSAVTPADVVRASLKLASVEGDFVERANRVANDVRDFGLPLVFFHENLSDQIAARVAGLAAAPVQVSIVREPSVDANLFDGWAYLAQNGLARSRFAERLAQWIPPASDIESRLKTVAFENKHSLGIESASSVSATFSGPPRDQAAGFIKALIEILKRFPKHFHLFAGPVEVRAIRGMLHSEGVLPRVRFLGQVTDTTPLLGAIDVYLAPFPDSGRASILEMMAAGKPVVAMRHAANSEFNTAAELVEERELTPPTSGEYIHAADRLLRDAAIRHRLGDTLIRRFRQEFTTERLGDRFMEFIQLVCDET